MSGEKMTADEALSRAKAILNRDNEAVRSTFWNRAREFARVVAVRAAGMPKERGFEPLKTFNALERIEVASAIRLLVRELETIEKAMKGGEIPDQTGGGATRFHKADQRAEKFDPAIH